MARIVLVADSATGKLIDVAGNGREGGRYKKFAKRLLSTDTDPVLDYGDNGGDTLEISSNGGNGKEIKLLADTVSVPNVLKINGKTVAEIAAENASEVLNNVIGTTDEIVVTPTTIQRSGEYVDAICISLHNTILGKIETIDAALSVLPDLISKSDVAEVISGLSVAEDDTLEDVKGTLRTLLARLNALVGDSSSSSSASSPEDDE